MAKHHDEIVHYFGNKLRIRVNGIYLENHKLLMVKHIYPNRSGFFWSPPGGGMEFGSSASENLVREFMEETGLKVKVGELLFVHEFLNVPLHAIELFFSVLKINGGIIRGFDPEIPLDRQIISEIKLMDMKEIKQIARENRHQIFDLCDDLNDLLKLRGYLKLK